MENEDLEHELVHEVGDKVIKLLANWPELTDITDLVQSITTDIVRELMEVKKEQIAA